MRNKDRFLGGFESLFLGVIFAWTLATAVALVQPPSATTERHGVVEIYSLTPVPSSPSI